MRVVVVVLEVMDTVTDVVAVSPPLVLTMMVADPSATAVTTPVLLTVATAVLLLLHVYVTPVALLGVIAAVSCEVCPAVERVSVVGLSDTAVAVTALLDTVTVQVLVSVPTEAVMTAVPVPMADTSPDWLTVATAVLLLDHVEVASDATFEATRVSCDVLPATSPSVDGVSVMEATVVVVVLPVVAVVVSVPSPTIGSSIWHATVAHIVATVSMRIAKILSFIFYRY